ncbi:Pxp2 protein [Martiniozyma asiatica (nom. inval.)]|nr:Pxp2 protein [Martiniozyma asiatica]
MILSPQRLHKLSALPHLQSTWYLITAATLTVCNKPEQIPYLYHYVLHQNQNLPIGSINNVLSEFESIQATGENRNFSPYRTNTQLFQISEKFRETILKTAPLSGLPHAINSLTLLRNVTPNDLLSRKANRNLMQPEYERGQNYWNSVYTKISNRITSQLSSAYPDLWTYTLENVYAPLLSYMGILNKEETSLIIIASLIPQDVNPQLKGHLKGAVNGGVPVETVREARQLAIEVAQWCGIEWKESVATI